MRPLRAAAALSLLSCLSLASAWPDWLPERDALIARQPKDASATPTPAATAGSAPAAKQTNSDSDSNKDPSDQTNLNTAVAPPTSTGHGGKKGGSGKASAPSHTTFNELDPAGAVVMVTPAVTAGMRLYKIGDYVTFGWSYTSLQGPPTAVDVLLSCSAASETWTLTTNMTFQTSVAFTWDSNQQATAVESPLPVDMYTLIIADADDPSVTAAPSAGFLAPFSGLTFGMYTPEPYVPLSEWQCPTCSGAPAGLERHAVGFALAMGATTILSFTWFVTGFGISLG